MSSLQTNAAGFCYEIRFYYFNQLLWWQDPIFIYGNNFTNLHSNCNAGTLTLSKVQASCHDGTLVHHTVLTLVSCGAVSALVQIIYTVEMEKIKQIKLKKKNVFNSNSINLRNKFNLIFPPWLLKSLSSTGITLTSNMDPLPEAVLLGKGGRYCPGSFSGWYSVGFFWRQNWSEERKLKCIKNNPSFQDGQWMDKRAT